MTGTDLRETSAIREAATDWVVHLNDAELTPAEREGFVAWLRRSPAHVKEYLYAEAAWQAMEGAAREDPVVIRDVLRDVPAGVFELPKAVAPAAARVGLSARRWRWAAGIAAILVLGTAAVVAPRLLEKKSQAYASGIGEMRKVTLADGSTVELNTRSRIRVRITAQSRDIYLDAGEAFFKVASDSRRPFRVSSDAAVVRALGTQFNVYRQRQRTVITVVEGRVAVESAAHQPGEASVRGLELAAGHNAVVGTQPEAAERNIRSARIDALRAVAWRQSRLIFENDTLADVAAEFNRYNERQLVIEDAELGVRRINGIFNANRPDALLDFLAQGGDVRVTSLPGERILLSVAH